MQLALLMPDLNINKKILYPFALILGGIVFFYSLTIDWSINWPVIFGGAVLLVIILLSAESAEKLFLGLLIIFPGMLLLHNYKINLSAIMLGKENYNLPINLTAILSLFYIFFGIITAATNRLMIKKIPLRLIFSVYSFAILLSLLWTSNLSDSLIGIIYLLTPLAAYFIAYRFFASRKNFLKVIFAVIISSILPVIISFYQIAANQYFYEPDSSLPRIAGPFAHPNLFGLYLFIIISVIFIFWLSKKDKTFKTNWLIILWAAVLLLILALTYSRVSWAALGMTLIIMGLIRPITLIFLAAASPVLIFLAFSIENIRFRLIEIFNNTLFNSMIARKNIWQVALKEIIKNPYLGYGVGSAENVIAEAKNWSGGTSLPHNDFLQFALELGIVGAALFLILIISTVRYCLNFWLEEPDKYIPINLNNKKFEFNLKIFYFGSAAILISLLLASFFESTSREIAAQIIIWSLLGSLFGLKKQAA